MVKGHHFIAPLIDVDVVLVMALSCCGLIVSLRWNCGLLPRQVHRIEDMASDPYIHPKPRNRFQGQDLSFEYHEGSATAVRIAESFRSQIDKQA